MVARDHSASKSHTSPSTTRKGPTKLTREVNGTGNRDKCSSSQENTILLTSLETDHPGSLSSGSGEGLPTRTGANPLPDQPSNIRNQASQETDAFRLNWESLNSYAFSPFCLIGKCLQKIQQEQSTNTMVVPQRHSQVWYPTLMECLVDCPVCLPNEWTCCKTHPINPIHC